MNDRGHNNSPFSQMSPQSVLKDCSRKKASRSLLFIICPFYLISVSSHADNSLKRCKERIVKKKAGVRYCDLFVQNVADEVRAASYIWPEKSNKATKV